MQPALFLLLLAAVQVSVLVDCRPRFRDARQRPDRRKGSFHTRTGAETPAGPGGFSFETSGSSKRGVHTGFLVLPETSDFVSIFDLRRKRFVCMDINGELYVSRQRDLENCLFLHIWIDVSTQYDVYYSVNGAFKLRRDELHGLRWARPEALSAPLQLFLGSLVKRQRRSEEVNPSDPLRTHSDPPLSATDQKETAQPEQDQAGAVSKETISSCDDPLKVLQQNGPVSPVKNIADGAEQGAEQD